MVNPALLKCTLSDESETGLVKGILVQLSETAEKKNIDFHS
jgi:hypothetical protein